MLKCVLNVSKALNNFCYSNGFRLISTEILHKTLTENPVRVHGVHPCRAMLNASLHAC